MDEAMTTMSLQRKRAAEDQVRVAYGAVPVILEALPADDPFRIAIRDRARSLLVALGYLTAEELATLPEKGAITAALRRVRAEIGRTGQVRGRGNRSGMRSAGVAPRATEDQHGPDAI